MNKKKFNIIEKHFLQFQIGGGGAELNVYELTKQLQQLC